jgi:hypothetical protein
MRFVGEKTNIPVPSVIAWGLSHENPLGVRAFIIMELIEGTLRCDIEARFRPERSSLSVMGSTCHSHGHSIVTGLQWKIKKKIWRTYSAVMITSDNQS